MSLFLVLRLIRVLHEFILVIEVDMGITYEFVFGIEVDMGFT